MDFVYKTIRIGDLINGYQNDGDSGVFAYGGNLAIRPAYQREFVYNHTQQVAVIETVMKNWPLNIMYWADNGDGKYEILDGQQRTMSICEFCSSNLYFDGKVFDNYTDTEKDSFLDKTIEVRICNGNEIERLDWFKRINIAGVTLTDQELLNAVYTGSWLSDAKRYFSKQGCAAYQIGNKYIKGTPIRQDYLETALSWVSDGDIQKYMSSHHHSSDASEMWVYYQNVINWIKVTFTEYYSEMKGLDWGKLYRIAQQKQSSGTFFNPSVISKKVSELMEDDDVTKKSGIYSYIITGDSKYLNIRSFDKKTKRETYQKQNGICTHCNKLFDIEDMEADHITPWHLGGQTSSDNCQMLCVSCNRKKSGK